MLKKIYVFNNNWSQTEVVQQLEGICKQTSKNCPAWRENVPLKANFLAKVARNVLLKVPLRTPFLEQQKVHEIVRIMLRL